jgi:hypothetical protein
MPQIDQFTTILSLPGLVANYLKVNAGAGER